ncbi:MAG: FMN-binding protein [Tissierella sp.]|uniref:FMN-binding protein n=1 Tax=Tissierella sp. TaxID=41274 RepID=UPI003F9A0AED
MKKSFAYPIIFMSLVTAVFAALLATLDYSTAEQIEFLANTELQEKILYVFDIPVESEDPEEIDKQFEETIETKELENNKKLYLLEENGEDKAYAFPVSGSGLWGNIEGYAGISADYSTLIGIDFISHSETPGLGGRISEEWFKEQFRGIDLEDPKDEYIIYTPASGGNVDAITGATLTSQSVREFLNEDIEEFIEERKVD